MTSEEPKVNGTGHYSIGETCEALCIDRSTLRRYTNNGLIRASYHRTGKKFYSGDDIKRFWNSKY